MHKPKTIRRVRMPGGTSRLSPGIIITAVVICLFFPINLWVIAIGGVVSLVLDMIFKVSQVKVQNPPTQTVYTKDEPEQD